MKKNKKDSFLLYSEHSDLINELSDEQAGELFKKLFSYVATGKEPSLDGMQKMAFISIRQDLDRNAIKYEETVKQRRIAGKKGGEQRAINMKKNAFLANADFGTKFVPNQADNVNVNDNENENENVLSSSPKREKISKEDREILENYIKRKKLATKSIKAYASKLISNGDYKGILEEERKRYELKAKESIPRAERIKQELESIHDKRSCARVLAPYYLRGCPPDEFTEVMEKYDLDTYDKIEAYGRELSQNSV